jgi:hypothetical protein
VSQACRRELPPLAGNARKITRTNSNMKQHGGRARLAAEHWFH